MDGNQRWFWPVPNQKAVTTRTGTTSNPQDLFGFSSTRQILAMYQSTGIFFFLKKCDQSTFIGKTNEEKIKTGLEKSVKLTSFMWHRPCFLQSFSQLLFTRFLHFIYICLKFLTRCTLIIKSTDGWLYKESVTPKKGSIMAAARWGLKIRARMWRRQTQNEETEYIQQQMELFSLVSISQEYLPKANQRKLWKDKLRWALVDLI